MTAFPRDAPHLCDAAALTRRERERESARERVRESERESERDRVRSRRAHVRQLETFAHVLPDVRRQAAVTMGDATARLRRSASAISSSEGPNVGSGGRAIHSPEKHQSRQAGVARYSSESGASGSSVVHRPNPT